ncbi:hypothetical protein RB195_016679 [Necator americanus]|uniref:G-protein coupled receptors family 1 profile domain-containing protein n=1 Tax=Necator americanus TaxID=51031 RepID=A0ABR1C1K9_NECAM
MGIVPALVRQTGIPAHPGQPITFIRRFHNQQSYKILRVRVTLFSDLKAILREQKPEETSGSVSGEPAQTIAKLYKEEIQMVEDLLTCLHKIHPDETPLSHRLTFGIVMLIVTFTSLAMNIVITIIIFRTNAVEKLVRPYIFGMVAASVIFLLTNCWALLPTILFNLHINDPYNAILATPNSIGYLMIMFTTTTMAFDRFLIFFAPKVIQFLLICAAQFASSVAFYVLPPIAGGHDIAFYMTAIFSTLNTMTNPCVIFVFQPRVRKAVHLFTTGKLGDVSTVVSKVPTAVSKF